MNLIDTARDILRRKGLGIIVRKVFGERGLKKFENTIAQKLHAEDWTALINNVQRFELLDTIDAGCPFENNEERNKHSCFDKLIGKHGVYIFKAADTGTVYYIGEAPKQDVETRISQHYSPKNSSATFRINYCKKIECKENIDKSKVCRGEKCKEDGCRYFEDFRTLLNGCELRVICVESKNRKYIGYLEELLIATFQPTFNIKDK